MTTFVPTKQRVHVSGGESIRILRELQELSTEELGELVGMSPSMHSALEHDEVYLSIQHAKEPAHALRCHPAVLAFPGWTVESPNEDGRSIPAS